MKWIEGATEEQRTIIESYRGGPLVVEAIPGSGKTFTNIRLAAKLFHENPTQNRRRPKVRLITFTRKATNEAKERLTQWVGDIANVATTTFHQLAFQIYRNDPNSNAIWPANCIVEKDGVKDEKMLKMLMYRWEGMGVTLEDVKETWTEIINDVESYEDLEERYMMMDSIEGYVIADAIEVLKRRRLIPLDLFVPVAVSLLRRRGRGLVKYLLVDEFQDTNASQMAFSRELIKPYDNLIAVGDYHQAIYRWRGAKPENITVGFDQHFPDVNRLPLTVNFRSTPSILDAGSSVLPTFYGEEYKHTPVRPSSQNNEIYIFQPQTSDDEGAVLVKWISRMVVKYGLDYKDIMVLYRTHRVGVLSEKYLVEHSIPYQLISGNMFFGRKEVKDIMAYMAWSLNPSDSVSAKRVINRPRRRIGSATLKRINTDYTKSGTWVSDDGNRVKSVMTQIHDNITMEALSCEDWMLQLLHQTGIWGFYSKDEERLDSFQLIIEWARSADKEGDLPQDFYANLLIVNSGPETSEGSEENAVKLMTIHGSKGLESKGVFIAHGVEGIMPTSWASDISEECHLAYVAVTRAETHLAISMPRTITTYKGRKPGYPSRFFEHFLERDDVVVLNDDFEI